MVSIWYYCILTLDPLQDWKEDLFLGYVGIVYNILFKLCRGIVNDTYKMDLILIHPPHLIALACIYIASVSKDKDTIAWFEELRVDMNVVSITP